MSKSADCLVSDLVRTIVFYNELEDRTAEMDEILRIAEQMVATISAVRQTQIMRASLRNAQDRGA